VYLGARVQPPSAGETAERSVSAGRDRESPERGVKRARPQPDEPVMKVLVSPEARRFIKERGGMLFVRLRRAAGVRASVKTLVASTEPPGVEVLDYQRIDAGGFLIFLPPGLRLPRELHLEVRGWVRRRVDAFWNGCAFVFPEPRIA
jgi:hypothetical protein